MREWNGFCQRCGKKTCCHSMSRFNTQLCCMDCLDAEQKHPKYKEAAEAELAACRRGNYNFAGIGKPAGL